jgi:hypothetical protein
MLTFIHFTLICPNSKGIKKFTFLCKYRFSYIPMFRNQRCFNKVVMDEPCFALKPRNILYWDNYPNTEDAFGSVMKNISIMPVIKTFLLIFQADIWLLSMDHEEDLHDKLIRQYCKGMKHEYRPIILSHSILTQPLVFVCMFMYYFFHVEVCTCILDLVYR